MVTLPLAPSCFRIRIVGKINSVNIAHILHASYGGGTPNNTDCAAFALGIRNAWNTNFGTILPNTVTYNLFEVLDLSSLTGAIGSNTTVVTGAATPAPGAPNSLAIVVSWKVAYRFRGGHCRTYLPYQLLGNVSQGNQISIATANAIQANAQSFLTAANALTSGPIGMTLSMVSYWHNKALRPTGIPYAITAAQVHQRIDTQRRRLGKEF